MWLTFTAEPVALESRAQRRRRQGVAGPSMSRRKAPAFLDPGGWGIISR
jgi:hypothetical protein